MTYAGQFILKLLFLGALCLVGTGIFASNAHAASRTVEFFDNASGSWRLVCRASGVDDSRRISEVFAGCATTLPAGRNRSDGRVRFVGWSSWPGANRANISVVGDVGGLSDVLRVYSVHVLYTPAREKRMTLRGGVYLLRSDLTAVYLRPANRPRSVRIPDSVKCDGQVYRVTEVGNRAFKGMSNLREVSLGANVRIIRSCAFERCNRLKRVTGLDGLRIISRRSFYGCRSLKQLLCTSADLASVGARAFSKCAKLTRVVFKSRKLASVGKGAFSKCRKLKRVTYYSPKVTTAMLKEADVL